MSPNSGNGRSNWPRGIVGVVPSSPAEEMPKNGLGIDSRSLAGSQPQPGWKRIVQDRLRHLTLGGRLTERGRAGETGGDVPAPGGWIIPRCPVEAVAAAQHGVGIDRVGPAYPRRRLDCLRIALVGVRAADTGVNQAAAERLAGKQSGLRHERVDRVDRVLIEADGLSVVHFAQPVFMFEPQAVVQGKA